MSSKAKKASVQATGTKSKSQGSSAGKKTKSEKVDVESLRNEIESLNKENKVLRAKLSPEVFEKEYGTESSVLHQEFVRIEERLKQVESGMGISSENKAAKVDQESKIQELELEIKLAKQKLKQSNALVSENQQKIDHTTKLLQEKGDVIKRLEKDIQSLKSTTESNGGDNFSEFKKELAKLKVENQSLTKETDELRKENGEYKSENVDLKNELKSSREEVKHLENDLRDKRNKSEQLTQLVSEKAALNEEIRRCKEESDGLKKRVTELSKEKPDLKQLEEDKVKLNNQIAELKQNIKNLNDENKSLSDKITEFGQVKDENERLLEEISEYKKEIEELKEETVKQKNGVSDGKAEIESLRKRLNEPPQSAGKEDQNKTSEEIQHLCKQVADLKTMKDDQESKIAELKNTCHEAFTKISQKEKEMKKQEEDNRKILGRKEETINKLRKELVDKSHGVPGKDANLEKLRKAEEEISELKNRLSKVVGAKLADDNPNITDLSDINRPTKLSEKYSELYDNEWTDAFEECEDGRSETESIGVLYKMLDDSNSFCQKLSENYIENIKRNLFSLPGSGKAIDEKIDVTRRKQLKEISKSFAPYLVDEVSKAYLNERKQNPKPNTLKYLKKCLEICWLMNVQDPPVFLDTSEPKQGAFDSDRFRTYTKSGKTFDFVVWPPLLLHSNGPLLCKGVAQAK